MVNSVPNVFALAVSSSPLVPIFFLLACYYREAMSTIWRTWTQRSGLYTNDNEVLTHLSRRFKLEAR